MAPRKRTLEEVIELKEPMLSTVQQDVFKNGIRLFNQKDYWKAHESWEMVWQSLSDEKDDDAEIIIRGLIQLAAAMHCLEQDKLIGARNHISKSKEKLRLFPDHFLGINIPYLIQKMTVGVLDRTLEIEI